SARSCSTERRKTSARADIHPRLSTSRAAAARRRRIYPGSMQQAPLKRREDPAETRMARIRALFSSSRQHRLEPLCVFCITLSGAGRSCHPHPPLQGRDQQRPRTLAARSLVVSGAFVSGHARQQIPVVTRVPSFVLFWAAPGIVADTRADRD